MNEFLEKFFAIVISLPLLGMFLYSTVWPEDSILSGMRWRFRNEDLEPSEGYVKLIRVMSIIFSVIWGGVIVYTIFS